MQRCYVKLKQLLEKDWLCEIVNLYKNINPVYRQSFWTLFIITNIVFGFHTINFLYGNHDWGALIKGTSLNYSLHEGRYGAWIISKILTGDLYLPILSALWAYVALSLSAVLLAIYWKLPKKTSYFIIFGLVLNITPYTLSWLWYAQWTINIFFARLFIIAGFVLSDKFSDGLLKTRISGNLLAIILLNFGLAIYTAMIGTFVMVLAGRVLIEMMDWKGISDGIVNTLKKNIYTVFNIFCATAVFEIIFKYLEYKKLLSVGRYNMETTPISEITDKVIYLIKATWKQFINFSMPFYPSIITYIFLFLTIIFILQILLSKRPIIIKVSIVGMLVFSLFLTKTVALISAENWITYNSRVEFCGYVLFNALIIALCLKLNGILQNIKLIASVFIIYVFLVNDLHQQRTWKLGFDAERMTWNKVAERINKQASFDYKNKYKYIQIGDWSAERPYFVNKEHNLLKGYDTDLLHYSFTPRWAPQTTLVFYNHYNISNYFRHSSFTNPKFMSALKRIYDAGLLENAKAWPAENSIIVYEDIILVIMNEYDLQKAKHLLAEQAKNEQVQEDKAKSAETSQPQVEAE